MIPKIIHYCWLSNDPLPRRIQTYIDNWKKKLPDYDFILWNLDRFDINLNVWVKQAFEEKKYAFAADFIRLYALYHFGGIYLDTDVEVVKPFDPLLGLKTMLCYEDFGDRYEMATFGAERYSLWVKKSMDYYENRFFIKENGIFDMKVLPKIIVEVFTTNGFKTQSVQTVEEAFAVEREGKLPIFPSDCFSPKSYATGKISKTKQTYSIHHFAGSWLPRYVKLEHHFWQFLGLNDPNILTSFMKVVNNASRILNNRKF